MKLRAEGDRAELNKKIARLLGFTCYPITSSWGEKVHTIRGGWAFPKLCQDLQCCQPETHLPDFLSMIEQFLDFIKRNNGHAPTDFDSAPNLEDLYIDYEWYRRFIKKEIETTQEDWREQSKSIRLRSKEYIANNTEHCPWCNSEDIGKLDQEDIILYDNNKTQGFLDMICDCCGKKWREIYTITEIEEIDD